MAGFILYIFINPRKKWTLEEPMLFSSCIYLARGHRSHSGAWTPELHGPRQKTPCPWPLSCLPPVARQPGTECCCRCAAVSPANRHLKCKLWQSRYKRKWVQDFSKYWSLKSIIMCLKEFCPNGIFYWVQLCLQTEGTLSKISKTWKKSKK